MIRITLEVSNSTASFELAVRAESLQGAVNIAEALYPGAAARVLFPIEPETFFVEDPAEVAGPVGLEMPKSVAG